MDWGFPDGSVGKEGGTVVKNLPANQETGVQSLGQEDPLQEEMQPSLLFLLGKFHGGLYSMGSQRIRHG